MGTVGLPPPNGFDEGWESDNGTGGGGLTPDEVEELNEVKPYVVGSTGEANKIYIDATTKKSYIWDYTNSVYISYPKKIAMEKTIYRDNVTENIPPNGLEIHEPVEADTATVYLQNSIVEIWQYANVSGVMKWKKKHSLKENLEKVVNVMSTSYTAQINDDIIVIDSSVGAVAVTLPFASDAVNQKMTFKMSNYVYPVTITPQNFDAIDSVAGSRSFDESFDFFSMASDGSDWFIVAEAGGGKSTYVTQDSDIQCGQLLSVAGYDVGAPIFFNNSDVNNLRYVRSGTTFANMHVHDNGVVTEYNQSNVGYALRGIYNGYIYQANSTTYIAVISRPKAQDTFIGRSNPFVLDNEFSGLSDNSPILLSTDNTNDFIVRSSNVSDIINYYNDGVVSSFTNGDSITLERSSIGFVSRMKINTYYIYNMYMQSKTIEKPLTELTDNQFIDGNISNNFYINIITSTFNVNAKNLIDGDFYNLSVYNSNATDAFIAWGADFKNSDNLDLTDTLIESHKRLNYTFKMINGSLVLITVEDSSSVNTSDSQNINMKVTMAKMEDNVSYFFKSAFNESVFLFTGDTADTIVIDDSIGVFLPLDGNEGYTTPSGVQGWVYRIGTNYYVNYIESIKEKFNVIDSTNMNLDYLLKEFKNRRAYHFINHGQDVQAVSGTYTDRFVVIENDSPPVEVINSTSYIIKDGARGFFFKDNDGANILFTLVITSVKPQLFGSPVADMTTLLDIQTPQEGETRQILADLPFTYYWTYNESSEDGEKPTNGIAGSWSRTDNVLPRERLRRDYVYGEVSTSAVANGGRYLFNANKVETDPHAISFDPDGGVVHGLKIGKTYRIILNFTVNSSSTYSLFTIRAYNALDIAQFEQLKYERANNPYGSVSVNFLYTPTQWDAMLIVENAGGELNVIGSRSTLHVEEVIFKYGDDVTGTIGRAVVIDDDTMDTATEVNVPSSESVKAYIDSLVPVRAGIDLTNEWTYSNYDYWEDITGLEVGLTAKRDGALEVNVDIARVQAVMFIIIGVSQLTGDMIFQY